MGFLSVSIQGWGLTCDYADSLGEPRLAMARSAPVTNGYPLNGHSYQGCLSRAVCVVRSHPGRAVKRAVTPKVVKKASRAMHLLPHRRVTGHDPRFMAKNRYFGTKFKSWDEHDISRPQVAACPTRKRPA